MKEIKYKIFVINLDRSTDRLVSISEELKNLNLEFERISAIDGKAVSEEFLNKYYSADLNKKNYYAPLTKAEIGCYISHLKACEKIVSDNLDFGIILEDDLVLEPSFALVSEIISSIKEDWNYIKLATLFKKKKIVSRKSIYSATLNGKIYKFDFVKWNKVPVGAQAYAITLEGAKEFLKKRSIFYRPIDVDLQFEWETKLNVCGLLPQFCKNKALKSDIGSRKLKYHYPFARLIYKLKYLIKCKLYLM